MDLYQYNVRPFIWQSPEYFYHIEKGNEDYVFTIEDLCKKAADWDSLSGQGKQAYLTQKITEVLNPAESDVRLRNLIDSIIGDHKE